jgi:L,D-transpeptidase YbiS
MPAASRELLVDATAQTARLRQGRKVLAAFRISTAKAGLGSEPGSMRTPTGKFSIAEKIGAGALWGTIFISRQAVGLWSPAFPTDNDLITSRILWLDGLEPGNANTHSRYIYLHGTNQEDQLGTPASHGCIRFSNHDIIRLFDLMESGDRVIIRP